MTKKNALASNLPLVVVLVIAAALALLIFLSLGLQPDGAGSVTTIGNEELRELVADGALLVDVRTQSEYDAGHIDGAILAPVDQVAAIADDWDRDRPVVLICATGARSGDAARAISGMGFDVFDHTAGLVAWDGELTNRPSTTTQAPVETAGMPIMYEFSTDS